MLGLSEIKTAEELGYKSKGQKYIWVACVDCGRERWVQLWNGKPMSALCRSCSMKGLTGSRGRNWKGGISGQEGYYHIWLACKDCGKERWVQIAWGKPRSERCHSCSQRGNRKSWRGGMWKSGGYIFIQQLKHPRANSRGYIKRAILALEQRLGRPLLPNMVSHHKNGIKDDDRPENLEELTPSEHARLRRTSPNHLLQSQ